MSYFSAPPVVVGYDASPTARAALMVAAGEALRRGRNLLIVHAQETSQARLGTAPDGDPLAEAVELVRPMISPSRVVVRDRLGAAAHVLCEQAAGAELLVVGRGDLGMLGWFAGSVAIDVTCCAPCPVMVVGDPGPHIPHSGPVIAGVDREHAEEVLGAAFREADLRRCELVVVHSWNQAYWVGPDALDIHQVDDDLVREHRTQWIRDVVQPFQQKYPAVPVTEAPRQGRAATVLTESSGAASLIVVGSRGRGPVRGLLLGSVGQALVRHALCPVMVVRSAA
jgi:nucleotide-binding universal stress UspA family protein